MGSIKILDPNLFLHMIVLSMLQAGATMQTEKTFQTCLSALDAVGGLSHLEWVTPTLGWGDDATTI